MTNTQEKERGAEIVRSNRMRTAEDVAPWKEIIGEQNAQACLRAIADGASIWTFISSEEIDACADLDEEDKKTARMLLQRNSEGSAIPFAGIVKRPLKVGDMTPIERLLNGVKEYPSGSGGGQPSH